MKYSYLFIFLFLSFFDIKAQNTWTSKTDLTGAARILAVAGSIGTKGYIGTGQSSASTYYKDFWEWNQSTNTWTQKADFGGTARTGASAFVIGTKFYIGLGQDGTSVKKDFWEWNQSTNTWTAKADFGGTARKFAVGLTINGNGYFGTGNSTTGAEKDFWQYNPSTNVWAAKANLPGPARGGAFAAPIFSNQYGILGTGAYTDNGYVAVQYNGISDVAFDAYGNLIVAGNGDNCVRKVASDGVVTTIAGNGSYGYTNATGSAARFSAPASIAVDAVQNIYVSDCNNHSIRKITPLGVVTTLAGNGTAGYADGTGTAARFTNPGGIVIDGSGNLYVADAGNHRIRKITSAGVVTTIAGDGTAGFVNATGTSARFNNPTDLARDAATGNLFVTDKNNNRIRKITSGGVVTTFAGSGTAGLVNGTGTGASFNGPCGIAMNAAATIMYISDAGTGVIRKITSAGVVTTYAGTGTPGFADGAAASAQFQSPAGMVLDPAGNLYEADNGTHRIRRITTAGIVSTYSGSGTQGYVDGSSDVQNTQHYLRDCWIYVPGSDAWIQINDFLGSPRTGTSYFLINDQVYVGLGTDGKNTFSEMYVFDYTIYDWKQVAEFPKTGRAFASGFSIGNKGYFTAGTDGFTIYKDLNEYSLATILTGAVTVTYNCDNASTLSIPYRLDGTVLSGNYFFAELSDDQGSFDNPKTLSGTLTSTTSGTITATLPANIEIGALYRVRVRASSPVIIGTDNGAPFSIGGAWTQKANLASAVRNAVSFSIGKKGYITTGRDASNTSLQTLWEWDQATDTWTQKANIGGVARWAASGFSIGTKGYVVGGRGGSGTGYLSDMWEWDQATNTWTAKASFGGGDVVQPVTFSIGKKGYVATGLYYNENHKQVWEWDQATDVWTRKADYPGAMAIGSGRFGFSIGSKGYVGGGWGDYVYSKEFWEFDIVTNTWTKKADMPDINLNGAGFSIGTKGYYCGGNKSGYPSVTDEMWFWDQSINRWFPAGTVPGGARNLHVAFTIANKAYIGTGYDDNATSYKDLQEFNPCNPVLKTGTVLNSVICAGSTISVPFTMEGTVAANNRYIVQLSNVDGVFNGSQQIGTITSTANSGTISATIPAATVSGSKYRVRVIATSPSLPGLDNGDNLSVASDCGTLLINKTTLTRATVTNPALINSLGISDFTIEAWVNMDVLANQTNPVFVSDMSSSTNGIAFFPQSNGTRLALKINSTTFQSSAITSIYDNACHHVAVSRSGSTLTFVLDGVAVGTAASAGLTISTPSNNLFIGCGSPGGTIGSMQGTIDDVRFWNISRTATTINSMKSTNVAGNTTGLIACWNMNEQSGQAIYDGGVNNYNGNLGTTSSTESVDAVRGSSACFIPTVSTGLSFDGSNDRVTIPHSQYYNVGMGSFTLEAWVKLNTTQSSSVPTILSKRSVTTDGFILGVYNGTQLFFQINATNYLSATIPTIYDNQCHHIAVVRSGNNLFFYLDGAVLNAPVSTNVANSINSPSDLLIGIDNAGGSPNSPLNGNINEVRIWNTARTAEQIQTYKNETLGRATSTYNIAYFRFKEASGQTCIDLSILANNGSLGTNATQFDVNDPVRITNSCYSADRIATISADIITPNNSNDSSFVQKRIRMFPNPSENSFNVEINNFSEESNAFYVFDIQGTKVAEYAIKNNEPFSFGAELKPGIYFVKFEKDNQTHKLVKISN